VGFNSLLAKARRVQEEAAKVGFDWPTLEPILEKLREELSEFEKACSQKDELKAEEELGDLFFTLVNIARVLKKDADRLLQRSIDKFKKRFNYILTEAKKANHLTLTALSFSELDKLWEKSKKVVD
jgi:tetrapyrrole methylase family protein/MazG family protein